MKIKYFLLCLCLIYQTVYAQDNRVKLVLKTNSEISYIFLNDKLQGKGNIEIGLLKGNYKITIKESLIMWTGSEIIDSIKVTGLEKTIEKYYSIGKQILLNSEPQDAQVFAKDSLIGYTPLFINKSVENITLLKDFYASRNLNLANVNNQKIDLGLPVTSNSGGFIKSVWFKVLLGTAAVLGATSAYYKIQADKKYDDYLIDRNSSSLSDVNRLDSISGIALGAFQINFGVLLYLLLSD